MLRLGTRSRRLLCTGRVSLVAAGVMTSWLLVAPGDARGDLLGDIVKPFASVAETYDSNVFRVRDRQQLRELNGEEGLSDFITVATVGTRLHYGVRQQQCDLLLRRDMIRFSHYSNQNVDQDKLSGHISAVLFDRLRIRGDGSYSKVPQSRADYRSAGLNIVTSTVGGVTAGYETASGVGVEAGYSRSSVDYSLPQLKAIQYSVDRYTGTVSYAVRTLWRVYASYQRDYLRYGEQVVVDSATVNNNVADSAGIGVEKTFSPRTGISGSVGFLNRRHNTASVRDFSGPVGRVAVAYGVTGKLGMRLNWERQLREETFVNRIYSVNDAVGIGLVYDISDKVSATVSELLSWNSFRDLPGSAAQPRSDFSQEVAVGVEWRPVKRLAASVGYRYGARHSDDSTFDFTDHTVSSKISYSF